MLTKHVGLFYLFSIHESIAPARIHELELSKICSVSLQSVPNFRINAI